MDFFEAQDNARRKTGRLVVLFALAVLTLIAMTNVVVAVTWLIAQGGSPAMFDLRTALTTLPWTVWLWVSLGVLTVVLLASLSKYLGVRGGGRAVAEGLGGRRVQANTSDLKERRLLNVVEEMAIAAGIAVPPVYIINSEGINAFAAGYTPDDAVIGITGGALNLLNREELQGVIGHEYSHILNGDTRINIRLLAVLYGIVFIGLIGGMLLRGSRYASHGSGRNSGGSMAMVAVILGASLAVIGYAGTFFGNLIKAGVSRQREYLADAAAVQFTRNPQGISGALQKIGGASSQVSLRGASEISHMFFGQAMSHFMGRVMATHPPLPERIRAIDPGWSGQFPAHVAAVSIGPEDVAASAFAGPVGGVAVDVESLPDHVGRPDRDSYLTADRIIDTTNGRALEAARDPCQSHLLVYALLLHADSDGTSEQFTVLAAEQTLPANRNGPVEVRPGLRAAEIDTIRALGAELEESDELHRLALAELAVPGLKQMSLPQYREFVARVIALIRADRRIELFEWVLHRVLLKELRPHFEDPRPPSVQYHRLAPVTDHALTLLRTLAGYASTDPAASSSAFRAALAHIDVGAEVAWKPVAEDNFKALNDALSHLRRLAPLRKPALLKACAASVLHDQHINPREAALLQGISATLDCPLPPSVVARQRLSAGGGPL